MAVIEITGLTVDFGGVRAVSEVDLTATTGRILGLIGPNGAGKSTLLNCISGITRPSAGRITLEGADLAALPPHRIAGLGIGRVFQQPELIGELTVLDNLLTGRHASLRYGILVELLALPAARRGEAAACAAARAMLDRLGIAVDPTARIASLAYGHRKLIELGRALLTGARFLLLDEPVAGLNDGEIERLAQLLLELRRELSLGIILVEHNMGLVTRLCDHVVVLDAGAVIARGSAADVLRDPKVMAAYLGEAA
jgi:branched-chain amino acid transport system ATP-binding protein